jgi:hypothetical protein
LLEAINPLQSLNKTTCEHLFNANEFSFSFFFDQILFVFFFFCRYAWGDNSNGQLGLGDKQKRLIPTLIKSLQNVEIVTLAAGKSHTIAISGALKMQRNLHNFYFF